MRNGHFLTRTRQSNTYIVDKLLAPNRLSLWGSCPGEGKSLCAGALGYAIPYEANFLNMGVTLGNVMFIDSENRLDILQSRALNIKKGYEKDGYSMKGDVDFQHYSGFLLDDKSTWQKIEQEIRGLSPSLIILDHLACFHHQDEDRETSMKRVTTALEELMGVSNSSILVLHHFNKSDGTFFKRLRGSSALYAKTDVACEIRALSTNNGRLETIGFIPQARKEITPDSLRIKVEEGTDCGGNALKVSHSPFYI